MTRPAVGDPIPAMEVVPTLRQFVRYAGASGDFYDMHYDLDFAAELGHPDLAVHGLLKAAFLGRMIEAWLDGRGRLAVLDVRYRGMDFRDRPCRCGGEVSQVDGHRVSVDIWTESADGARTTVGHADVMLELRSDDTTR